jgi:hypothetical protein
MDTLAPLVGEILGVERASIEIVDDGMRHSVRVGDAIVFETRTSGRSVSDTRSSSPLIPQRGPKSRAHLFAPAYGSNRVARRPAERGGRDRADDEELEEVVAAAKPG